MKSEGKNDINIEMGAIKALTYYSFFDYPLTVSEIVQNHPVLLSESTLKPILDDLVAREIVFESEGFYSISQESLNVQQRREDEQRLLHSIEKIKRASKVISKFPFVRSVLISGSVSKGVLKNDGDVDFFIITENNRLWVARTLLILNKKIVRLNSRKYFCVNYFLGEDSLAIPDKNLFTSVELAHLIPVYGESYAKDLINANAWYKEFLPNDIQKRVELPIIENNSFRKKVGELFLSGKLGDALDRRMKKKTLKRWKKKFQYFGEKEFELAMRSERNVSKHHPSNFQIQLLEFMEDKLKEIESKLGAQGDLQSQ